MTRVSGGSSDSYPDPLPAEITCRAADGSYFVRLRYWPELNNEMRRLGAHWNAAERGWSVPAWAVDGLDQVLHEYGLARADEVTDLAARLRAPFTPARDPFFALLDQLPVTLRQPAYRALARALHPDAGGDTAVMQALNRAYDLHRGAA